MAKTTSSKKSKKPAQAKGTATTVPIAEAVPSAFNLFKPSWEGVKLNIVELIMIFLVPTAVLTVYFLIAAAAAGTASGSINGFGIALLAIGVIATIVYAVLLGPAITYIQLRSARMQRVSYENIWETSKKFWWRYLILSVTVGVTVLVGLILLIVPGIIFIRRYFLSQYALIDQDLRTVESMRASNQLSRGRAMSVFGILGVDILIGIPSFIPVVGSVISFILQIAYFCAPAIRYQQLKALKPLKPAA